MKFILLNAFLGVTVLHISAQQKDFPIGTLSLTVLDEAGKPVKGATVEGAFSIPKGFAVTKYTPVRQITDAIGKDGDRPNSVRCRSGGHKDGYYRTGQPFEFTEYRDDRWLPDPGEMRLVLRKIGNPVPMYAAHLPGLYPPAAEGSGFDLQMNDWVAPYGKGKTADLVFSLLPALKPGEKRRLRLGFSNPGDGVIPVRELIAPGSQLKLPREAPEEGYSPEYLWENEAQDWYAPNVLAREPVGFIFRVRSVLDTNGKVIKAWYGKIGDRLNWEPPTADGRLL